MAWHNDGSTNEKSEVVMQMQRDVTARLQRLLNDIQSTVWFADDVTEQEALRRDRNYDWNNREYCSYESDVYTAKTLEMIQALVNSLDNRHFDYELHIRAEFDKNLNQWVNKPWMNR